MKTKENNAMDDFLSMCEKSGLAVARMYDEEDSTIKKFRIKNFLKEDMFYTFSIQTGKLIWFD